MTNNHFVYMHTSPSGKVYVEQTVNIKRRWGYNGEHYSTRKKDGSFIQAVFARAIAKYGWDAFEHRIILENVSKSEADYAEKYLIRWYKMHNISYNITDGGEGVCGVCRVFTEEEKKAISRRLLENPPMKGKHHSEETKRKLSLSSSSRKHSEATKALIAEASRGRKHTEEAKQRMREYRNEHPETWIGGWNKKEVHQYDLDGNYINTFPSATEAAIYLGNQNDAGKICECVNGRVASSLGFVWTADKVDKLDMSKYKRMKTAHGIRLYDMSEEGRRKRRNGHGKPVNQYTLDGEYITTFDSVTDAGEQVGYRTGIGKCCNGLSQYQTAGGYLWRYDTGDNRANILQLEADDARLKEKEIAVKR